MSLALNAPDVASLPNAVDLVKRLRKGGFRYHPKLATAAAAIMLGAGPGDVTTHSGFSHTMQYRIHALLGIEKAQARAKVERRKLPAIVMPSDLGLLLVADAAAMGEEVATYVSNELADLVARRHGMGPPRRRTDRRKIRLTPETWKALKLWGAPALEPIPETLPKARTVRNKMAIPVKGRPTPKRIRKESALPIIPREDLAPCTGDRLQLIRDTYLRRHCA